jgi:2-hydroxychromene-2-carboxylate isomerase
VHYFHQVDDPYSALTATVLPRLVERYDIELLPHVVGPPSDAAAPDRDRLVTYSRRDAELLGQRYGLNFHDTGGQPDEGSTLIATAMLVAAVRERRFVESADEICTGLWNGSMRPKEHVIASAADVAAHCNTSESLRQQLGHYLGATFYYGGEWYWGIDRLHYLERRLQQLGASRGNPSEPMFSPAPDLSVSAPLVNPQAIDFFFSFRSPYSAIVARRVFDLGRFTGAEVRLRFVLPMVMRGLPVPRVKSFYIVSDTAREARLRGIPFGRMRDPVGRPTERGLSLIPYAQRAGRGQQYVLAFMQGVWAKGIGAGSDRGLKKIVATAGLSWSEAQAALADDSWRQIAEHNRRELFELGLWGVPSFRVGGRVGTAWRRNGGEALMRTGLRVWLLMLIVRLRRRRSGRNETSSRQT